MTLRASFQDSSSQAWDVTACNMHLSALFIVGNTLLYCAEADVYKFCMTSHCLHDKAITRVCKAPHVKNSNLPPGQQWQETW